MRKIVRQNDDAWHPGHIHHGVAYGGDPKLVIEGIPVATSGTLFTCVTHGNQPIIATGPALVNGHRIAMDGDIAACGSVLVATTTKTFGT